MAREGRRLCGQRRETILAGALGRASTPARGVMPAGKCFVIRLAAALVATLPVATMEACSATFNAGQGDGGDDVSGDDGTILIRHEGGASTGDATLDAADAGDAGQTQDAGDAQEAGDATIVDAHEEVVTGMDAAMHADSAHVDAGCGVGQLSCDGGCVLEGVQHCGTCTNDCTNLPHVSGSVSCTTTMGACSFSASSCTDGWADCDNNPANGCETDITQPSHCGACNTDCDASAPTCAPSGTSYACSTGCMPPTPTFCNGTCVNTATNTNYCGSCTTSCTSAPPNAQPDCDASTCGWRCNKNYSACNGACIVTQPDSTNGVFVSVGGATSGCGAPTAPCGTIAAALDVVASSGGAKSLVYLADGTYTEAVTLPAGITVEGGWQYTGGGVWTHQCVLHPEAGAIVQAPATSNTTVTANYSGSSTLSTLTITSKGGPAASNESIYGVFASGASTSLFLSDVAIDVIAGGAGTTGGVGATAGSAGASCAPGAGGNAGSGAEGNGASAGTYSASGYSPTTGGTGVTGPTGGNGTAAPSSGAGAPTCVDGVFCSPSGMPGICIESNPQSCGGVGTSGCGGLGSTGGNGGTGGGSSIGVFLWDSAAVTVAGSAIATGNGGNGGNGGAGGAIGSGTAGAAGAAGNPVSSSCVTATCTPSTAKITGTAGAAGGTGGKGGQGGQGGGGSGGDSYCYYVGGTGSDNLGATSTTCTPGSGGLGGDQGGTGQGASGHAGTSN